MSPALRSAREAALPRRDAARARDPARGRRARSTCSSEARPTPASATTGGLEAAVVCATEGARGGIANGARYEAAPPPGPLEDTYGAGDSFAAALCFALARGDSLADALALAARAGAAVVTGKGPYTAQISL